MLAYFFFNALFLFLFIIIFYLFIFLLYNIVLGLPYINMHPPWVYTCSPSWTLLPPPSPYHPSGSSQCTSPRLPVSCIKPGLAIHFLYDIIHVLMLASLKAHSWTIYNSLLRLYFLLKFDFFSVFAWSVCMCMCVSASVCVFSK